MGGDYKQAVSKAISDQILFSLLVRDGSKKDIFANYNPDKVEPVDTYLYRCKECDDDTLRKPVYISRISHCKNCGARRFKRKRRARVDNFERILRRSFIVKKTATNQFTIWLHRTQKVFKNLDRQGFIKQDKRIFKINLRSIIRFLWKGVDKKGFAIPEIHLRFYEYLYKDMQQKLASDENTITGVNTIEVNALNLIFLFLKERLRKTYIKVPSGGSVQLGNMIIKGVEDTSSYHSEIRPGRLIVKFKDWITENDVLTGYKKYLGKEAVRLGVKPLQQSDAETLQDFFFYSYLYLDRISKMIKNEYSIIEELKRHGIF